MTFYAFNGMFGDDHYCNALAYTDRLAQSLTQSLIAGLASIHQSLPHDWPHWLEQYHILLNHIENPHIFLLEPDPWQFCAAVITFLKNGRGALFLGNPAWKIAELRQVAQLLQPDCFLGSPAIKNQWLQANKINQINQINQNINNYSPQPKPHSPHEPLIYFPTGGSSGKIRFAAHSLSTLSAAVQGLTAFLTPFLDVSGQIHSFCVLPLFHVGGFMQWWRSALTKGKFCPMNYGQVKQSPPLLPQHEYITSLVPTQLSYLMDHHPQFLQQFKLIFLGGAPAWPELLTQAQALQLPLALTYGMTETAGQIATLTPTEFLQGQKGVGKILPHAKVTLKPTHLFSDAPQSSPIGLITLKAQSLFLGYYPHLETLENWETGDLGILEKGDLQIIGRQNRQIISGGENIDPQEIENYLLDHNFVKDIVIVGLGDRHWGEVLTAIFVPQDNIHIDYLIQTIKTDLAPHKCPKHWLPVPDMGRSPMGKINYQALQTWAETQIPPST